MNELLYDALIQREEAYVGHYYAAVRSTGIYCCMNCPCKKPKPENVAFFADILSCLIRGYRECKVCRPLSSSESCTNERLLSYLRWLELQDNPQTSYKRHPIDGVDALGEIKRGFKKRFEISLGQYIRIKQTGYILKNGKKAPGQNVRISYNYIDTPLGEMIACFSGKGLILLEFINRKSLKSEILNIAETFDGYFVEADTSPHSLLMQQLREYFAGERKKFSIDLDTTAGTSFQKEVWSELSRIPYGDVITYAEQARRLSRPSATRAVANANGKNMISIIIPCHRVIASDGRLSGYGGGINRKKWLLDLEASSLHSL